MIITEKNYIKTDGLVTNTHVCYNRIKCRYRVMQFETLRVKLYRHANSLTLKHSSCERLLERNSYSRKSDIFNSSHRFGYVERNNRESRYKVFSLNLPIVLMIPARYMFSSVGQNVFIQLFRVTIDRYKHRRFSRRTTHALNKQNVICKSQQLYGCMATF